MFRNFIMLRIYVLVTSLGKRLLYDSDREMKKWNSYSYHMDESCHIKYWVAFCIKTGWHHTTACNRPYQMQAFWLLCCRWLAEAECGLVFKMVHMYRVEQRSSSTSDSAYVCHSKFKQKLPGTDIPAKSTIHYVVNKFKTTALIMDKNKKTPCTDWRKT